MGVDLLIRSFVESITSLEWVATEVEVDMLLIESVEI